MTWNWDTPRQSDTWMLDLPQCTEDGHRVYKRLDNGRLCRQQPVKGTSYYVRKGFQLESLFPGEGYFIGFLFLPSGKPVARIFRYVEGE